MLVDIEAIQINPARGVSSPEQVKALSQSMSEIGLLNPITIGEDNVLIAGLHRLEAAKKLGWSQIECNVCTLEGLRAELAEIDENIIRRDLSTIEKGNQLLRRKEIYETLHPESKHGGDRKSEKIKCAKCVLDSEPSFVQDTAEKMGISQSTVRRQIQAARDMTPEAKRLIQDSGAGITQKGALKLSRLEPKRQEEAAAMLASGEIQRVDEYIDQHAPFQPEEKHFSSFKEAVADLKNPDKDCSCTPDSFLAEVTAFVHKYQRGIEWYSTPYYEVVFSALSPTQVAYLQEQMDIICDSADQLIMKVQERIKNNELSEKTQPQEAESGDRRATG